jgi:hypothetical protein
VDETIHQDQVTNSEDGVDRRGFLACMAWAGTGLLWSMAGGVAGSRVLGQDAGRGKGLRFVQISDSHIGFAKEPNKDVVATLELAIAKINALPERPELLIHTGDLTHLSTPKEFDTVAQLLATAKVGHVVCVPGEHDIIGESQYLKRFGKGTKGEGWLSFDLGGIHFVGLVNVASQGTDKGLGVLGNDQLAWLEADLAARGADTPIVVFAHVPLLAVYPAWGWGTSDGDRALAILKRFASVTILNGHIHQVFQKVEGNVTIHTARSTAFPQPEPGKAPSPGPLRNLPADRLRDHLGLTSVSYVEGSRPLAIVDSTLR